MRFIPALFLAIIMGAGCVSVPVTVDHINQEVSAPIIESVSEDDLLGFLLTFQETADILVTEYGSFSVDASDPQLLAAYAIGSNDIPLMRYLGKKGLNDLESSDIGVRLDTLREHELYDDFYGSVGKVDQGVIFLKRFYSNIEDLQTFPEFQQDTADLISARDEIRSVGTTFEFEYEVYRGSHDDLDFTLSDSVAYFISDIGSPGSYIALDPMDSTYYQAPIKFTGSVSSDTEQIVVTAEYGGKTDVYTLQNFDAGDTTFQYQASEEWNNLVSGLNEYTFVAYFSNGSTATDTTTINYYESSATGNVNLNNTYQVPVYIAPTTSTSCCKVCTTGKACGDSCISRSYTCHKGPGCACNGY
jgi:hypothetical protein